MSIEREVARLESDLGELAARQECAPSALSRKARNDAWLRSVTAPQLLAQVRKTAPRLLGRLREGNLGDEERGMALKYLRLAHQIDAECVEVSEDELAEILRFDRTNPEPKE